MPLGTEVGLGPSDIVLHGDPAPPPKKKAQPPNFRHVCCGQTAVCIRIPLGTKVGLSLGDVVLDGDPAAPLLKGHPQFSANVRCGQMAGWTKMPLGMEVGLDPVPPRKKGHSLHPIFGPCLLWPNGNMEQDATWHGGKPRRRRRCVRWGRSSA